MKKKICGLILCCVLAAGLVSCGSSMSYDDYELDDYIKVGEYKGLKAAPYAISVTEDEVDAQIQSNLEAAATDEKLDENTVLAEGDTVNIDYTGKVNGKEFEGGSAEGYDLTLGSGSFIDGFESGLVGKKTGDEAELALTFPEDYSDEDLAGKDVVFSVKINSATRKSVPQLNSDFVKNNTEYESVEEYTKAVEKQLYDNKETEAVNEQKTELWSQALDNAEVKKYPERELEHYIEFNSEQIDRTAKAYGMSKEDVLSQYEFGDEEEFTAVNEDSSKLRVKQEMLIEYIAAEEKLSYTDEEKQQLIENFQGQGYDNEAIEEQTGRSMGDYVHIELLYGKVLDMLLENAKIEGAAVSK